MAAPAPKPVSDIKNVGNPDNFQLLFKSSSESEGWLKSAKAMELSGGCLIQTLTQQKNQDGGYSLSESLCFIPNVRVDFDVNGGRKLSPSK